MCFPFIRSFCLGKDDILERVLVGRGNTVQVALQISVEYRENTTLFTPILHARTESSIRVDLPPFKTDLTLTAKQMSEDITSMKTLEVAKLAHRV